VISSTVEHRVLARTASPDPDLRAGAGGQERDRKTRAHLRGLQALGYDVTITPAA